MTGPIGSIDGLDFFVLFDQPFFLRILRPKHSKSPILSALKGDKIDGGENTTFSSSLQSLLGVLSLCQVSPVLSVNERAPRPVFGAKKVVKYILISKEGYERRERDKE